MSGWKALSGADRVLAVVCLVYPFRMLFEHWTGIDAHLGALSFVVVGIAGLWFVRALPLGFPTGLDLAVMAFVALALFEVLFMTGATAKIVKGFSIETRFAIFYGFARLFRSDRAFLEWLLRLVLAIGLAAAVVGILEQHCGWGWLIESGTKHTAPSFWKYGIPRLYSFPLSPIGAAYGLAFAMSALGWWFSSGGGRKRTFVALVVLWQGLAFTLGRGPIVLSLVTTLAFAVCVERGRTFALLSIGAIATNIVLLSLTGWLAPLVQYALVGGALADGSARVHASAWTAAIELLSVRPLGYGFGESGYLALSQGGVHPHYEGHYTSLAVQMGLPGLLAFALVLALAAHRWGLALRMQGWRLACSDVGVAGATMGMTLAVGGLVSPTWNMIVPQLYFWLLTAALVNLQRSEAVSALEHESA